MAWQEKVTKHTPVLANSVIIHHSEGLHICTSPIQFHAHLHRIRHTNINPCAPHNDFNCMQHFFVESSTLQMEGGGKVSPSSPEAPGFSTL